jgi:hypothetical protein
MHLRLIGTSYRIGTTKTYRKTFSNGPGELIFSDFGINKTVAHYITSFLYFGREGFRVRLA